MYDVIMKAFGQTVYMVIGSTIFSVILGFIPAIVLTVTAPDGLRPNKIISHHRSHQAERSFTVSWISL